MYNTDKGSCNYTGEVALYCVGEDSMCASRSLKVNEETLGDKETCQQLLFVQTFIKGTFPSLCTPLKAIIVKSNYVYFVSTEA